MYKKHSNPIQNYLIIVASICYLFITQTLGPQLWHIPFVLTGQLLLFIVYFIYTFNPRYKLFTNNPTETLLFVTGCIAIFIRYANGNLSNIAFYIGTTFIIPIIIALSFKYSSIKNKYQIKRIIYFFFILECLLAIYERLIQYSFFPFTDIENFAEYQAMHQTGTGFRSCSLLGNPLTNALIVMTIYPFLLFDLKKESHVLLLSTLTLLGLSSFNARGATLLFFIVFSLYYFYKWIYNGRKKTFHIILFIGIALIILLFFSQTEIAGRLFHGEKVMDASAQTRLTVLSRLHSLDFTDLFFGNPSKTTFFSENGVINFIILNGAPFLILYLFTYIRFIKYYMKNYSKLEQILVFISSFGVAALNPSFTSNNYIIFLIFGLTIFPHFKNQKHGSRISNYPAIQQR